MNFHFADLEAPSVVTVVAVNFLKLKSTKGIFSGECIDLER